MYRHAPDYAAGKVICAVMSAVKRIAKDRSYQVFVLLMMVFWLGASQIDITYP